MVIVCAFERVLLYCVQVLKSSVLRTVKIPSEYLNNRNPLMLEKVNSENGQFGQSLSH